MHHKNINLFKIDYDRFQRLYLVGAVKLISNQNTAHYLRVYPSNKDIICFYQLTICLN